MESKPSQPNGRLTEQKVKMKLGHEKFFSQSSNQSINVLDFWKWSASNLLINTTRGVLAEFLVASSLGLAKEPRNNWDSYDIKLKCGIKIEVKSAAKYQAWKQDNPSRIEFGISKPNKESRPAHIYVFCVLNEIEPLNLNDWDFYVLPTEHINERCGDQRKISLTSLQIRFPELKKLRFDELNNEINFVARDVQIHRENRTRTT